jgi:hypothetical protein
LKITALKMNLLTSTAIQNLGPYLKMEAMKAQVLFAAFVIALSLTGCKKPELAMAPMGESAPAFGQPQRDLKSFVVGRWCVVEPMAGIMPGRYYEFKADGTFEAGVKKGDWKSTGKWQAGPQNVTLTYETMKGKAFEAYRAEYKKDEEGGGQVSVERAIYYDTLYDELGKMNALWVDSDGKHLTFAMPTPLQAAGSGAGENAMDNLAKAAAFGLERMAPKKDE